MDILSVIERFKSQASQIVKIADFLQQLIDNLVL